MAVFQVEFLRHVKLRSPPFPSDLICTLCPVYVDHLFSALTGMIDFGTIRITSYQHLSVRKQLVELLIFYVFDETEIMQEFF